MSQALYQKYRPKSFDEVIGQDEAILYFNSVLKQEKENSTESYRKQAPNNYGNINHAYLLTGGRGIGKTTLARLFARSLGTADIDIIELDTASNRGIDEIKELRDQVYARPINSKYKVFILDEVHMITTQGANALLKTLEEPTPWTIFILCTTDPEKLISTIVSRCQVIKLKSPNILDIQALLKDINEKENLNIDEKHIENIAANHNSYRDAIGSLERASYIDIKNIEEYLGINYTELAIEILMLILDKDIKNIFIKISELESKYKDINYNKLYLEIVNSYREALLIRVGVVKTVAEKALAVDGIKGGADIDKKVEENIDTKSKIDVIISKYKDKIRSDLLKSLLDNENIWTYKSIDSRAKFELIVINIV